MTYSIGEFATLTGLSKRTLRFYHERGLLKPIVSVNGYRQYRKADVNTVQLIRMYSAMGFTLAQVEELLRQNAVQRLSALQQQRQKMLAKRDNLDFLTAQIDSTILNQEGHLMTDAEKFAAFKMAAIEKNDKQFGSEVLAEWGRTAKRDADLHFGQMDETTYQHSQSVEQTLFDLLRTAVANHLEPESESGAQATQLHKSWLAIM